MFWRQCLLAWMLLLPCTACPADGPPVWKEPMELPAVILAAGKQLKLSLFIAPVKGFHLADAAPSRFFLALEGAGSGTLAESARGPHAVKTGANEIRFSLPALAGSGRLLLKAQLYFCPDSARQSCLLRSYGFKQAFTQSLESQAAADLEFRVE